MNTKRWVLFFFLFILLISLSFASYLYHYRAEFISLEFSKALNTPIKIKNIDFSKNGLIIKGLRIQNSRGCAQKIAFQANQIDIKISLQDILKALSGFQSQNIMIERIKINKPEMDVELFTQTGSDTNWKYLLNAMSSTNSELTSRKFVVKKLLFSNVQLAVKQPNQTRSIPRPTLLKRVELQNIGEDSPKTLQQVFYKAFSLLTTDTAKELQLPEMEIKS